MPKFGQKAARKGGEAAPEAAEVKSEDKRTEKPRKLKQAGMSGKADERFTGSEVDSLEQKLLKKRSKADEQLEEARPLSLACLSALALPRALVRLLPRLCRLRLLCSGSLPWCWCVCVRERQTERVRRRGGEAGKMLCVADGACRVVGGRSRARLATRASRTSRRSTPSPRKTRLPALLCALQLVRLKPWWPAARVAPCCPR